MEHWYDTHAHLDRYAPVELDSILARAAEAEVLVIGVGTDLESSAALLAIKGLAGVTVGIHPASSETGSEPLLREIAGRRRVCAVGECGFDAEGPSWELQAAVFRAQVRVARDLGLAVVIHVDGEGAWEQLVAHSELLEDLRVIRHYFTGDEAQAAWHAERRHYLSFGNPLRRDRALRDIAREYPEDRLLIETDSYPLPGRNTEPAHVVKVGETFALLRDWTFAYASERLAANTRAAFNLPA